MDLRNGFVRLCYNPSYDAAMRTDYLKNLPPMLKAFSDFMGTK
jgi:hypothetical protein